MLDRLPIATDTNVELPPPPIAKEGWPLLGPAMAFQEDPVAFLRRCRQKYGNVFSVNLLVYKATFVLGAEETKRWLLQPNEILDLDAVVTEAAAAILGPPRNYGRLMEYTEAAHSIIRGGLMKKERLNTHLAIVREIADENFEAWCEEPRIDLFRETSRLINQINIVALIGRDAWERHGEAIARAYYDLEVNGIAPEAVAFPNLPTPAVRRCGRARDEVNAIMAEVIADRRARPGDDYVSHWLSQTLPDGTGVKPEELTSHLLALFFAAHTNTTGTFAWTVANLAARRELWERAVEESRAFLEGVGGDFEYAALRKLPFLDACMREAVRMSFAVLLMRRAMLPYRAGDFEVPEGQVVCIAPIITHLDPAIYNEPERFDPDRFADVARARQMERDGAYLQFGLGTHRCLGEMFANAVLKGAWTRLFSGYEIELESFELPPKDFTKTLGTAYPTRPVWARVRRR